MKAIRRELQILKMVEHPHIIYLYKVFESNTRIYLLLERCTGELGKLFKNSKPFSEKNTKTVMTQLADVVDFLHKNGIYRYYIQFRIPFSTIQLLFQLLYIVI